MSESRHRRALMALFDAGHQIDLPNGYWIRKSDDNRWQIGGPMGGTPDVYLAMNISGNVPVGEGGSMDQAISDFAAAISAPTQPVVEQS